MQGQFRSGMTSSAGSQLQLACFNIVNSGINDTFNSFTAKGHATATIATAVRSSKRPVHVDRRGSQERQMSSKGDELRDPKAPSKPAAGSRAHSHRASIASMTPEAAEHYMHAQMKSAVRTKWGFKQTDEVPMANKLRELVGCARECACVST